MNEFTRRCHAVEAAYEFMLAYAAQGLPGGGAAPEGELREHLARAIEALSGIGESLARVVASAAREPRAPFDAFRRVLEEDAGRATAAIELVRTQPAISSQLVDNLNASIHLRALLTDLFVVDEILSPQAAAAPSRSPTA